MRFNALSRSVTALIASIAVFAGVLFCTVDTLSAAISPGHSAHRHAHLHSHKSEYLVSPRDAQSDGTDQCCDQLLAVRPSTEWRVFSFIQTIPSLSPVSVGFTEIIGRTNAKKYTPQKIPRLDIAGKIVQNKRKKLFLKILPPFGPPV